jgi:Flp pilus assembly pilin Flp
MLKSTASILRKFQIDERGISSLEVRVVFAVIAVAVIWSAISLGAL